MIFNSNHPSRCGENSSAGGAYVRRMGSPPRMRGKLSAVFKCYSRNRITPADAGKTSGLMRLTALRRDHPRGCGENRRRERGEGVYLGSPPRMRGKPGGTLLDWWRRRITPADAGKTLGKIQTSCAIWDHPRRCGENRVATTRRTLLKIHHLFQPIHKFIYSEYLSGGFTELIVPTNVK